MIPQFLNVVYNKEHLYCVDNSESAGYVLETLDAENLYCPAEPEYMPLILVAGKPKGLNVRELCSLGSNCVKYIFPLFTVIVEYKCGPYIKMGEDKEFVMRIMDSGLGIHRQYFANTRLYSDDGLIVRGGNFYSEPLQNLYGYEIKKTFTIHVERINSNVSNIIADISLSGRHTSEQVKISFLAG